MEDVVKQFQEPLSLILRWGHVLAAIVAVGGLLFSRFALVPALEDLDDSTRDRVHEGIRRSWLKWVIGAITLLLITGLANYLLMISRVNAEAWGGDGRAWMRFHGYHAFMGVKILFAFALFYLASALVGRGEATRWARDDRRKWLTIAVGLGLAVVILSGYLRQMHTGPNTIPRADDGERMGDGDGTTAGARGGFGGGMGGMAEDDFGGGGFGGGGFGGGFGGGRGRGPRGGGEPPDEGTPEPGADRPEAPPAAVDTPPQADPPDEGTPEPGADAPANSPAPAGAGG